jgi:hypothetical protein
MEDLNVLLGVGPKVTPARSAKAWPSRTASKLVLTVDAVFLRILTQYWSALVRLEEEG